jgi:hypothetical protein
MRNSCGREARGHPILFPFARVPLPFRRTLVFKHLVKYEGTELVSPDLDTVACKRSWLAGRTVLGAIDKLANFRPLLFKIF